MNSGDQKEQEVHLLKFTGLSSAYKFRLGIFTKSDGEGDK